jgi:hypothetical protein
MAEEIEQGRRAQSVSGRLLGLTRLRVTSPRFGLLP